MMTVGSMSRNAYLSFKIGQTNSTFANIANTKNPLLPSGNLFGSNFGTSNSNDLLQNALSKQLEQSKDAITKLDDYTKTSNKFYSGFVPKMDELKKSSENLRSTDFSSGKTADIVSSVKDFADKYNSAANFLNDNKELSQKIANLATSFESPKYNAKGLSSIGINVDNKGMLSVDEAKLSSALSTDASKVGSLLGEKGLASQTAGKATAALNNSTDMIPFPQLSAQQKNNFMQGMLLDIYS